MAPGEPMRSPKKEAQRRARLILGAAGRARISSAGNGNVREMEIAPGALLLKSYLTHPRQQAIAEDCRTLMDGPVPGYVPVVRGGGRMHVRMLCLGRHWNGEKYTYEPTRSD